MKQRKLTVGILLPEEARRSEGSGDEETTTYANLVAEQASGFCERMRDVALDEQMKPQFTKYFLANKPVKDLAVLKKLNRHRILAAIDLPEVLFATLKTRPQRLPEQRGILLYSGEVDDCIDQLIELDKQAFAAPLHNEARKDSVVRNALKAILSNSRLSLPT